jgi:hypothetical protein
MKNIKGKGKDEEEELTRERNGASLRREGIVDKMISFIFLKGIEERRFLLCVQREQIEVTVWLAKKAG